MVFAGRFTRAIGTAPPWVIGQEARSQNSEVGGQESEITDFARADGLTFRFFFKSLGKLLLRRSNWVRFERHPNLYRGGKDNPVMIEAVAISAHSISFLDCGACNPWNRSSRWLD